jgi:hypothetical protein
MKLTPDNLATFFGAAAALAQGLGQAGIISTGTAGTASAVFIGLLGWISNKNKPTLN